MSGDLSKHLSVAIDGPAGAGKTSLAKELSKRSGFVYVDTGAIYRAFAVHKLWLSKEVAEKDSENGTVTNETALRTFSIDFVRDEGGEQVITLFGENINPYLRTEEVSMEASNVGVDPAVRAALLELQRRQAYAYDVVMEGRDIGTVVLPNASLKIFLVADIEERARRRMKDLISDGKSPDYCTVLEDMRRRDWQDTTRKVAPLRPACDSVHLDNTKMTFGQTVEYVLDLMRSRLGVR